MVIKNLSKLQSTNNIKSPNVAKRDDIISAKHAPRSVCDTERDRRQHRDPLKEDEMQ